MKMPRNAWKLGAYEDVAFDVGAWPIAISFSRNPLLTPDQQVGWLRKEIEKAATVPVFMFPNTSGFAGKATHDWISLNEALLDHPEDMKATLLHEFAHVLADRVHYPNRDGSCRHDVRWRTIARMIGDDAERCHEYDYIQRKKRAKKYEYECSLCGTVVATARRLKHDGATHFHQACGRKSRLIAVRQKRI